MDEMASVLDALRRLPTAAVGDGMARLGMKGGWLPDLRPRTRVARLRSFAGRVLTIQYAGRQNRPGPSLSTYDVMAARTDQTVLLVAGGSPRTYRVGGNISTTARLSGFEAIVVDGGVRDSAELEAMDLGIFSTDVSGAQPVDDELIAYDVPVMFRGTWVAPNDVLVADTDGAVVFPASAAADILREALGVEACEEKIRAHILARGSLDGLKALFREKSTPAGSRG